MGGRRRPPAIVAAPLDTRLTLPPADLVIMSYVLVEQSADDAAKFLSHSAFASARMIILVEPGTPAGFARIRAARAKLIASGARIVAPCPHDRDCPLADSDWCHMSVRLSRTRDHKHVKGGSAPFEDEPFSYLAAVRGDLGAAASSRVIRAPSVSKTDATLRLCTVAGIVDRRIPRRDKAGYKAAKALKWGDPVPDPEA